MAASTATRKFPQRTLWHAFSRTRQCEYRTGLRHYLPRLEQRHVASLLGCILMGAGGCGSDVSGSSAAIPAYWALRLDQHAITLAVTPPYNTIQLHATPVTPEGTPIQNVEPVQYRILGGDTSVAVGAAGLVTAKLPSYQPASVEASLGYLASAVVASLTIGGVTLADTAVVVVTATAPVVPLASLSIQPPPESIAVYRSGRWLNSGSTGRQNVTQLDVHGDTIHNLNVHFASSKPNVASINTGVGSGPGDISGYVVGGTVVITAQTWYYGVARRDSLQVTVGYPTTVGLSTIARTPFGSLTPELYWFPLTTELAAPATVLFQNGSYTLPIDVVFDDPSDVKADTAFANQVCSFYRFCFPVTAPGNIAPMSADTVGTGASCAAAQFDGTTYVADSTCRSYIVKGEQSRLFVKPGTYTYHTRYGNGGQIIVH